jgi:hypothetical protein
MNSLEPLFTVGLTKLTFEPYFNAQNSKNSNIKVIVYKYSHLLML